jgi:hypothetical protein
MKCCAQGYTELLDMLAAHKRAHGTNLPVDVYGSGEDWGAIRARAEALELAVSFLGGRDHLDASLHHYRCAYFGAASRACPRQSQALHSDDASLVHAQGTRPLCLGPGNALRRHLLPFCSLHSCADRNGSMGGRRACMMHASRSMKQHACGAACL